MLQLNFNPFPKIETERLILRELSLEDAPDYFLLRSDIRVMKYLPRPMAKVVDDAKTVIERARGAAAEKTGICWAVCLKKDEKLIGTIGYYRTQHAHYRSEIGYELHPGHWGKGIMSEAMKAALDYGFSEMKLHSIEAVIAPQNVASELILQRNHFLKEAHFREHYLYNGVFTDTVIYSLLKSRHLAMTGQLGYE